MSWDSFQINVSESTKIPYLELLYGKDLPIKTDSNRIICLSCDVIPIILHLRTKSKTVLHGIIRMKRTNAAFIRRYQSFDQGVKKVKSDKRERSMTMGSVLRQQNLHNFWTKIHGPPLPFEQYFLCVAVVQKNVGK